MGSYWVIGILAGTFRDREPAGAASLAAKAGVSGGPQVFEQALDTPPRKVGEHLLKLGLVSEVTPPEELMERARWVAEAIAEAPMLAVQGTLKAIWMAHEVARRQALDQVSTWVSLGTQYENIEGGQQAFGQKRKEWRLR